LAVVKTNPSLVIFGFRPLNEQPSLLISAWWQHHDNPLLHAHIRTHELMRVNTQIHNETVSTPRVMIYAKHTHIYTDLLRKRQIPLCKDHTAFEFPELTIHFYSSCYKYVPVSIQLFPGLPESSLPRGRSTLSIHL
jgi:hypothetical protein